MSANDLYQRFAKSWLVQPNESLFTEHPVAFAVPAKLITAADLDPAARAKAHAACAAAGVIDPAHLDSCTLDTAVFKNTVAINAFTHAITPRIALNPVELERAEVAVRAYGARLLCVVPMWTAETNFPTSPGGEVDARSAAGGVTALTGAHASGGAEHPTPPACGGRPSPCRGGEGITRMERSVIPDCREASIPPRISLRSIRVTLATLTAAFYDRSDWVMIDLPPGRA